MNKYIILLLIGFSFLTVNSCKSVKPSGQSFDVSQYVKGDSQEILDLSNKTLREFPDLSGYSIKKLNISNNKIQKVILKYLPKGILELDLSNNDLIDTLALLKLPTLQKVDVSNNKLRSIVVENCISNFDASNNDLDDIFFACAVKDSSMDTLNISNNKKLDNVLTFNPKAFKKIYRKGMKNDKELIWSIYAPIIDKIKISKKH